MVDEIKLKLSVYFNTKTYEVAGFACYSGTLNLDNEIRNILLETKKAKNKISSNDNESNAEAESQEVPIYINRWRFRTCQNEVRNLEFHFNLGDATRHDTLLQMLHVIMCLSLIDITVIDETLDAGGNNHRFARCIMRRETKVADGIDMTTSVLNVFLGDGNKILSGSTQRII